MNTQILLQISLIFHLTGLTLMAGTTVVDFMTFNTFSRRLEADKASPVHLLELMAKLSMLMGIGAALLITSGIGLMFCTAGVYAHMIWFKIKMMILLLLVLNGFLVKARQESKLNKHIAGNTISLSEPVKSAMLRLKIFYLVQIAGFLMIITLAVFKFN
ncbi:hypothetical protein [Chitinophaga sp.]|uniref:hypothetical protein n=1 Tax=Chitinophaga sp. TaxID=1869181 RepID=UPI002F95ADD9